MRYRFIHREKGSYPLTVLCQVLQVSRSGYYAFVNRDRMGRQEPPDPAVLADVRRVHIESRRTYGQRRLCEAFQAGIGILNAIFGQWEPYRGQVLFFLEN